MKWLRQMFGQKSAEEMEFRPSESLKKSLMDYYKDCQIVIIIKKTCDDSSCEHDHIVAVSGVNTSGRSEMDAIVSNTYFKINPIAFSIKEATEKLASEIINRNNKIKDERGTETSTPRVRRPQNRGKKNQK